MTLSINVSRKFSKIILVSLLIFSIINSTAILYIKNVEGQWEPPPYTWDAPPYGTWGYHLQVDAFINDTMTFYTSGFEPWLDIDSCTSYIEADNLEEAKNFTFRDLPFTDEEWSKAKCTIKYVALIVKGYKTSLSSGITLKVFNSNGESNTISCVMDAGYTLELDDKFDSKDELKDAHLQLLAYDHVVYYAELVVELDAYLPDVGTITHNNTANHYLPMLYDPNFDINDYHEIRPKGQQSKPSPIFPEENETHSSGQWYAGLGHKPSATSFAYTNNGFGYLYTDNDDNNAFIWSSSGFAQGMCIYGGGEQFGSFKVTNGSNSEESLGLYIDTSEPFDDELWLYTRAKIEDRGHLQQTPEFPSIIPCRACVSLGLFAGFQYVFEDGGELYYSNYMAPDETGPYPYLQALHCDLMIDRRWWDFTFQIETMQKGDTYRFSGGYFDDDRHLQLVMTEPMDELGVWYNFKINFTWVLETIRQMILEDFEKLRGEWGSGQIWYNFYDITKKWYNPDCYLKGLILREFYWFQEVNEAYQKSVTDYVILSSSEPIHKISVKAVPDEPCPYEAMDEDFDDNGQVDEDDLWIFCEAWTNYYNEDPWNTDCDLDEDGDIDEDDLWQTSDAFIDYYENPHTGWGATLCWIDGMLSGWTTHTTRTTEGIHRFMVPTNLYFQRDTNYDYYKFKKWTWDSHSSTSNPSSPIIIDKNYNIIAHYQFVKTEPMGSIGRSGRCIRRSPLESGDYGLMAVIHLEEVPESVKDLFPEAKWMYSNEAIDKYVRTDIRETLNNTIGIIGLDVFTSHQEIWLDVTNIQEVDMQLGLLWHDCGRGDYLNPDSFNVDDITLKVTHENVSRLDIYFRNVPEVISIEYYGLEFDQWEYTNNDLHLWLLPHQHSEIEIDFETAYSQSINIVWALAGIVIAIALLGFIRAKVE